MDPKTVRQYNSEVQNPQNNCLISVTGSTPGEVQQTIAKLFNRTRFEAISETSILVFGEDNKNPIGWISETEVPEHMSVAHLAEQRRSLQKVA